MNTVVVRCAGCRQLSRVTADAVGLEVACPRCAAAFVARPEASPDDPPVVRTADPARVPVVRPRPKPPTAVVWELPEPAAPEVELTPPTGGLIALALLPFGIPLLWLLLSAAALREVVLSFAVPVAVAVGVSGLGFGLVHVNRWSVASRAKVMVALLLIAYLTAGFLFLVKKEWLQDLRRVFNRGDLGWKDFRAPETATHVGYIVKFPGRPITETDPPIPDWKWKAHRYAESNKPGVDVYLSAVGPIPTEIASAWSVDDVWFAAVGKAVRSAAADFKDDGETAVTAQGVNGREYSFTGDGRNRVVRVYRVGRQAVYLSVEGPHLTPDAVDVQFFLESLRVP